MVVDIVQLGAVDPDDGEGDVANFQWMETYFTSRVFYKRRNHTSILVVALGISTGSYYKSSINDKPGASAVAKHLLQ